MPTFNRNANFLLLYLVECFFVNYKMAPEGKVSNDPSDKFFKDHRLIPPLVSDYSRETFFLRRRICWGTTWTNKHLTDLHSDWQTDGFRNTPEYNRRAITEWSQDTLHSNKLSCGLEWIVNALGKNLYLITYVTVKEAVSRMFRISFWPGRIYLGKEH
jgi:hypothetical protein